LRQNAILPAMTENDIAKIIVNVAFLLHKKVGPGLLESAYENALAHDLRLNRIEVRQQVGLPFIYGSVNLDVGYRIDLLVERKVLVELKSIETLAPVHFAKALTYLKLSGCKLGLLINFNVPLIKDRIHRIVNNL
jgi:GxxExxY protein